MKTNLCLCLLIAGGLSLSSSFQSAAQTIPGSDAPIVMSGSAQSLQEIQQLRANFHRAVVSHDGNALLRLVLPQASIWLNVLPEQVFHDLRQTKPNLKKIHTSSFQQFADFLNSTKSQLDPQSENIKIYTDGTIATIYFDYKFVIDGAIENQGSETWQVVNTEDGWKIAAITYSSTPQHNK